MRVIHDLTGRVFKRLTVIRLAYPSEIPEMKWRAKHTHWMCRCECGNTIVATVGALTSHNTKSCGCLQRDVALENVSSYKLTPEDAALRQLYYIYKRNAGRRNLTFSLTLDQFRKIVVMRCVYCGREPSNKIKVNHKEIEESRRLFK